MRSNLHKSFGKWLLENDFNSWLNQNLNMSTSSFVPMGGATVMAGKILNTPNGPVRLDKTTMFDVSVRDNGGKKIYKLVDLSQRAKGNLNKADFPHTSASPNAGRVYVMPEEEFNKLIQPVANPQNMGGGMGGL